MVGKGAWALQGGSQSKIQPLSLFSPVLPVPQQLQTHLEIPAKAIPVLGNVWGIPWGVVNPAVGDIPAVTPSCCEE